MQTIFRVFSSKSRGATAALLAVLMGLPAAPASSQRSAEEPLWYQVEVVIFERLSNHQGGDTEAWPKDIRLSYPQNWQKLLSAETAAERLAQVNGGDEESLVEETPPYETPEASGNLLNRNATPEPLPPLLEAGSHRELAFVRLPESERNLNQSAGAINRQRNMRILFHEARRQPMLDAQSAPSIIIGGGNSYGEHMELEGSLKVSVSRYLHVYSDLWLAQFMPNYGQESEHWPPLPPVPEYRRQRAIPKPGTEPTFTSTRDRDLWALDENLLQDYNSLIEQPFLTTEIVTMKQARRMRSGELHYLDHPRLGLLIRIDRYTPEPAVSGN